MSNETRHDFGCIGCLATIFCILLIAGFLGNQWAANVIHHFIVFIEGLAR